jgi:hypothetical protein
VVSCTTAKLAKVASSLAADNGAARVLVAELATITRCLSDIAVAKEGVAAS